MKRENAIRKGGVSSALAGNVCFKRTNGKVAKRSRGKHIPNIRRLRHTFVASTKGACLSSQKKNGRFRGFRICPEGLRPFWTKKKRMGEHPHLRGGGHTDLLGNIYSLAYIPLGQGGLSEGLYDF